MGLIFIEGFEYTNVASEGAYQYTDANRSAFYNNDTVCLVGSTYAKSGGAGFGSKNQSYGIATHTFSEVATIYTGFAIKVLADPSYNTSYSFLDFRGQSLINQHCFFHLAAGGGLIIRDATGAIVVNEPTIFPLNVWNYMEVKLTSNPTTGVIEVRLNGTEVANETGLDTQDISGMIGAVQLKGVFNSLWSYYDDWYIADDKFYGESKVVTARPDSDETYSDFTPSTGGDNYAMVDDLPIDDDSTYNESSVEGDKDSFGVTVGALGGVVHGVQVTNVARKDGGAVAKVKNLIRSNSTDYNSTEEVSLASGYSSLVSLHELDPGDSNPWTQSKIEAAEFGIEVTALSTTTTT